MKKFFFYSFGQLGTGDTHDRVFPINLKSLNTQRACYISCGEEYTAVLTRDGGVFTFGAGMYGQLGHNSSNNEDLPRKVFDLMGSEVTQISCGRCHTLAYLKSSNKLYSFGLCGNGQLGLGTVSANKLTPFEIKNLDLSKFNTVINNKNHKYLHSIYAGGDQSFILYTNVSSVKHSVQNKHESIWAISAKLKVFLNLKEHGNSLNCKFIYFAESIKFHVKIYF